MAIIDYSSAIGGLIYQISVGSTGSIFGALLGVCFFVLALCAAFRIPVEMSIAVCFPLMLAAVIVTSQFMPVLGVAIIYFAILMAVRFFVN